MRRSAGVAALLVLTACRAFTNYQGLTGPRFAADLPAAEIVVGPSATLRVVTFNVQWGRHVDRAIAVLSSRSGLTGADIITLQEMDDQGTRRIATAATVLVRDVLVRVYSVHLGTPTDIGPGKRRDQVRAVLVDALRCGYWDHIFFRGFTPPPNKHTGVVRDTLRTSDHDPVWAVAQLP